MIMPNICLQTNNIPLYCFELGRAKSNQFRSAAFGEHEMYTNRFSPFELRKLAMDFTSIIKEAAPL